MNPEVVAAQTIALPDAELLQQFHQTTACHRSPHWGWTPPKPTAPFAEFILGALLEALKSPTVTDQVSDPVTDQVKRLLAVFLRDETLSAEELMRRLDLKHKPTFRDNYLRPALTAKRIVMTQSDSPRSLTQRYRLE